MTGYAGFRDYVGTPRISTHPTEKQITTLSQEFCAGYVLLQIVRNPHRILARESESVIQWDVWIGVGSSAETAGSLLNPETRRTPSYEKLMSLVECGTAPRPALLKNQGRK